jgi:hypothetical protein
MDLLEELNKIAQATTGPVPLAVPAADARAFVEQQKQVTDLARRYALAVNKNGPGDPTSIAWDLVTTILATAPPVDGDVNVRAAYSADGGTTYGEGPAPGVAPVVLEGTGKDSAAP